MSNLTTSNVHVQHGQVSSKNTFQL